MLPMQMALLLAPPTLLLLPQRWQLEKGMR
jgi:hypothetical protein